MAIYFGFGPRWPQKKKKRRRTSIRKRSIGLLEMIFGKPRTHTITFKAKKNGKRKQVKFELPENPTQEQLREAVRRGDARVRGHQK